MQEIKLVVVINAYFALILPGFYFLIVSFKNGPKPFLIVEIIEYTSFQG